MKKITTTLFAVIIGINAFASGHTVSITTTNVLCSGACNGTATATVSGGVGPFAYDWAPATPPGDGTPSLTNLCGGSYTLTVTDSSDMSIATASFVIVDPPVLSVSISGGGAVCAGGCTTLTPAVVGGTFPYAFNWSGGLLGASPSACPASATNYTVTVTDANGCVATNSISIAVNPIPVVTVNSPTICAGSTATLTGGGATTYLWSTGATTNPLNVTPATTTSYTVTGSSLGCTAIAVSTVTVMPLPSLTLTTTNATCGLNNGGITPTGGCTYTWVSTGTPPAGSYFTGLGAGTYTVTTSCGGCASTAVTTISTTPSPTAIVPANITVCNGSVVPLGIFTSTPAGATFAWTNSNTAIGLAASGVGSVPSFTAMNPGPTPITSTITVSPTLGGCSGTPNTYTITVNPADDASFSYSSPSYCQAGTDPLPLITGVSPGVFSVTPPTLLFVTTTTGEINLAASSLGTYSITYTTGGLCSNSSSTSVIINSLDDASFNYPSSIYCQSGTNPTPTITGASGGTFTALPGLVIDPITGLVNLVASPVGTYTIVYTTSGVC